MSVNDISTAGNSGTSTATFTVARTGNTNGESTVQYMTSGGTATACTDYTAVSLTAITFAPVKAGLRRMPGFNRSHG